MKVVAINGSPRKEGNTYLAIRAVFDELEKEGIETEIIHVGNQSVRGCTACSQCIRNKDEQCVLQGDDVNEWIQKMKEADGIILGSPVYFAGVAGTMKSFLDRAFYVAGFNDQLFRHKVGASVVAVRRTGGMTTFQQLNSYLQYCEMDIPTGRYWNVVHGTKSGDALEDEEGIQNLGLLGRNMAWTLKLKANGAEAVEEPKPVKKVYTSFIR